MEISQIKRFISGSSSLIVQHNRITVCVYIFGRHKAYSNEFSVSSLNSQLTPAQRTDFYLLTQIYMSAFLVWCHSWFFFRVRDIKRNFVRKKIKFWIFLIKHLCVERSSPIILPLHFSPSSLPPRHNDKWQMSSENMWKWNLRYFFLSSLAQLLWFKKNWWQQQSENISFCALDVFFTQHHWQLNLMISH